MDYKDLEDAVSRYMAELSGMPMSFEAHLGRFVIHAAVLQKMYNITEAEMAHIVRYSKECHLHATEVPGASGKPN